MGAIPVLIRKIDKVGITYFYLTESGGMTEEVAVMAMEEQPLINMKQVINKMILNKVLLRLKDAITQ